MGISTGKKLDNSLTELAAGVASMSAFTNGTPLTGGSTLSSYGTIAHSNNYSLLTINRIILTYLYTGNGIFQTAIELPVQDALSKGVKIESTDMSSDQIDELLEWMDTPFNNDIEAQTPWETIHNLFVWNRLYGGAALVINTEQNPEEPLDMKSLNNSLLSMYDVDRWQMDYNAYVFQDECNDLWAEDREFYHIHGVKMHKSRIIRTRGKKAPHYVRRQLKGWGMSEGERMIRDLNNYMKAQDVLYEIMDEAKVDVYKIKNLAAKLLQRGGTEKIQNRVMTANMLKNYVNALILDTEEEYSQKTLNFSGMAEVMRENRIGVAAALRMPMTKLFGISASGFNTGESDLENYNLMVESNVRTPMMPIIKQVLKLGMAHLFGEEFKFKVKFPSLRYLSAWDEENIKVSAQNRALALYDKNLLTVAELFAKADLDGWSEIDVNISEEKPELYASDMGVGEASEGASDKVPSPKTSSEDLNNPFSKDKKFL